MKKQNTNTTNQQVLAEKVSEHHAAHATCSCPQGPCHPQHNCMHFFFKKTIINPGLKNSRAKLLLGALLRSLRLLSFSRSSSSVISDSKGCTTTSLVLRTLEFLRTKYHNKWTLTAADDTSTLHSSASSPPSSPPTEVASFLPLLDFFFPAFASLAAAASCLA